MYIYIYILFSFHQENLRQYSNEVMTGSLHTLTNLSTLILRRQFVDKDAYSDKHKHLWISCNEKIPDRNFV